MEAKSGAVLTAVESFLTATVQVQITTSVYWKCFHSLAAFLVFEGECTVGSMPERL